MGNLFQKSKLFVEAEIWNTEELEYVKFEVHVRLFYFRPFLHVLSKKSFWHFDVTWLISQQVIDFKNNIKT